MTTRQDKVNSLLQQEIAAYLLHEGLEGISGLLTITRVDVTPNLKHAKVYFSCVEQDQQEVLEILSKHIYEIQGMLNQRLEMKFVPRITFLPDSSGEHAQRVSDLLREIKDDQRR